MVVDEIVHFEVTLFCYLNSIGGNAAGFGTGNAGLFGASGTGVGLSNAYNGGFSSGIGSGFGSSSLLGGFNAGGIGNGFSLGK